MALTFLNIAPYNKYYGDAHNQIDYLVHVLFLIISTPFYSVHATKA